MVTLRDQKDGGWSWVVVGASFFINFMVDGVRYSFGLLYIEFLVHFDVTKGAVGLIGGIMFSLLLIAGVGFSMIFMTIFVAIIQRFDKYRSLAIGLAVLGSGFGGFAFNPIANGLIEHYTWRGALLVLPALLLNGCVCGAVMRPFQPDCKSVRRELGDKTEYDGMLEQNTQNKDADNEVTEKENGLLRDTDTALQKDAMAPRTFKRLTSFLLNTFKFSLLTNHVFLLFVVVEICINISYMVPLMYVPNMAQGMFINTSRTELVWIANAMSIANVVSRIPVGVLADLKLVSNVKLMGLLCVLAGVSCVVMPFCGSYGLLVTACVLYSASIVSAMVLTPVVLSELFGDDVFADSFGLSLFFGGVSGLVGTPLAGLLYDVTGTYMLTFIVAGVEFGLGGLVSFVMTIFQHRVIKQDTEDKC